MRLSLRHALVSGLLAAVLCYAFEPSRPQPLELWYWHHLTATDEGAVAASERLLDRAAAAGYSGVAFWDASFNMLSDPTWPRANVERLRTVLAYAAHKGLHVMALGAPFGWSNAALRTDGNLAEAQGVVGAQFRVARSGDRLEFVDSFPGLENAGFENGTTAWFDTRDAGIGINEVAHSGKAAAVIVDPPAHARFRQKFTLIPQRQYHLSLWFKTTSFTGAPVVEVLDNASGAVRFAADVSARGAHDWTHLDYQFNSQETTSASLYFGVWGPASGILWFDDVSLQETALVYVARRPGAPLRVYDPANPGKTFAEGRDFAPIRDARLGPPLAAFKDVYHEPPVVTLPRGTRLHPGQMVAIDYYAVAPLPLDNQVGMCLTEPAVFRWLEGNARDIKAILPPGGALLLSYDEMRQMNSCASCRAKKMTAGQLLAWNVGKTVGIYRAALPGVPFYVWSDMFDPYHNARKNYVYVEGDLAGSWEGLSANVTVLNWNHPHFDQSLPWFAGTDRRQPTPHRQILAGYYDSGDSATAAKDLDRAHGVPGIAGIMYVTWRDDYSQLEKFAESARKAWSPYLASLGASSR